MYKKIKAESLECFVFEMMWCYMNYGIQLTKVALVQPVYFPYKSTPLQQNRSIVTQEK